MRTLRGHLPVPVPGAGISGLVLFLLGVLATGSVSAQGAGAGTFNWSCGGQLDRGTRCRRGRHGKFSAFTR